MRRHTPLSEDAAFRAGTGTVGGLLLASAVMAADLAREHMHGLGAICGVDTAPHCSWCFAALALAVSGFGAFALALAPARAPAAPRTNRR